MTLILPAKRITKSANVYSQLSLLYKSDICGAKIHSLPCSLDGHDVEDVSVVELERPQRGGAHDLDGLARAAVRVALDVEVNITQ